MSNRLKTLRERATRHRKTVPVLLDGEVREQIEAVEDELDRLDDSGEKRLNTRSTASQRKALVDELTHLREQAAESTVYLVLEGMQRTPFRALLSQHPPRKDDDGKVIPADRLLGANLVTLAPELVKACVVGHREKPDADAPVLPMDDELRETVRWLLGYTIPAVGDAEPVVVDPWATERQIDTLTAAAIDVCVGDDAVPLPRRRSATQTPAAE